MYDHIDLEPSKEDILNIGDPHDYFLYLIYIGHDDEIYNALVTSTGTYAAQAQYNYCRYIEDREDMWRALLNTDPTEAFEPIIHYCIKVTKRLELLEHIASIPNLLNYIW